MSWKEHRGWNPSLLHPDCVTVGKPLNRSEHQHLLLQGGGIPPAHAQGLCLHLLSLYMDDAAGIELAWNLLDGSCPFLRCHESCCAL